MDTIIYYICIPLGYLMKWCWWLVQNYGLAIILFTLATKLVLLPLSIWIQKNSILMVKIQPEVNYLKANMQGNLDAIADGQSKIFKKAKYHPMLAVVPLILQIVLLLGVVEIIYHPMSYLFGFAKADILKLAEFVGANTNESSFQLTIIDAIKSGSVTASTVVEGVSAETMSEIVTSVTKFDMNFLGMNLSVVPSVVFGWYLLVPLFAGLSSWVLCFTQNCSNVLQHEQSNLNKYGIMALSVALSLYLGFFVPSGIALYWMASNLLSVAQMYLLNLAINPKKYVDYEDLENSRIALQKAKEFGKVDKKDPKYKEAKKREKQDYKTFKKIANKHIVFYSEKSGFYKYFSGIIDELLKKSNLTIHYVTNDYNDQIFEIAKTEPRIKPYYISLKKMVLLMMLVETDMFVMTTPDLNKFYLKRSFIKNDIEYIYVPHDMMSVHMGFREGALDAFDTIFCSGPHVKQEVLKTEEVYKLKPKTLVEFGYPLADELVKKGQIANAERDKNKPIKEILIAPSWQEDNLMDSCLDDLIKALYCDEFHIIVRPHPEYVKRFNYQLEKIVEKYKDYDKDKLTFELDFTKNKSIYSSDVLITDWSGVGPEFAFATTRPVVFINTKMKCLNENWQKIGLTPVELSLRDEIGVSVNKEDVVGIKETISKLIKEEDHYHAKIVDIFDKFLYNHGKSSKVGAEYILKSLKNKQNQKKTK